jgi:hypothetical protein
VQECVYRTEHNNRVCVVWATVVKSRLTKSALPRLLTTSHSDRLLDQPYLVTRAAAAAALPMEPRARRKKRAEVAFPAKGNAVVVIFLCRYLRGRTATAAGDLARINCNDTLKQRVEEEGVTWSFVSRTQPR